MTGRNARMARRLRAAADRHDAERGRRERAGDPQGAAREARAARDARRAADLLDAGADGVRALFAA